MYINSLILLTVIHLLVLTNVGDLLKHEILGDYVRDKVPSLKHFMSKDNTDQVYNIPSLAALSSAMRLLQRCSSAVKPWFSTKKKEYNFHVSPYFRL